MIRELNRIIQDDRYPLSARIVTLKAILGKLRPEPVTGTSKGTVTPDQTL